MNAMTRLAVFYFAYFCHLGAFVAYFSLWLEGRGHAPAEIAAVLAAAQIVRIVAPGAWGWAADLWSASFPGGRRGLIALASLCAAACLALLLLAESLRAVLAVVALTAFFTSGILPLVEAMTLGALGARIERYGPVRVWGSVGFIVSVLAVGSAPPSLGAALVKLE